MFDQRGLLAAKWKSIALLPCSRRIADELRSSSTSDVSLSDFPMQHQVGSWI